MIELLTLFFVFFKIGALSFGGGYAMIPVITDEVLTNAWLTEEEIINFIAVSETTPGPIAINMATFIGSFRGQEIFGSLFGRLLGGFFATLGVVLPSFIIILFVASIINGLLKFAGVKGFLNGVRPVVVGLIISTGISLFLTVILNFKTIGDNIIFSWKALVIFLLNIIVFVIFKKVKKKSISPILLILMSAILGMIFYGLL